MLRTSDILTSVASGQQAAHLNLVPLDPILVRLKLMICRTHIAVPRLHTFLFQKSAKTTSMLSLSFQLSYIFSSFFGRLVLSKHILMSIIILLMHGPIRFSVSSLQFGVHSLLSHGGEGKRISRMNGI